MVYGTAQHAARTELNLGHILIALPENPTSEQVNDAPRQAESIVEEARNGAAFGNLAITYSADPPAHKRGPLRWARTPGGPVDCPQARSPASNGNLVGPAR
ncbi:peptidylprolyl isomerase, partial [Salmonella enterica]|uniref:peptidylprolyl isomerase n=1 Tax=Salmonella enterica TaxID=28901 RepID=UPI00398C5E34